MPHQQDGPGIDRRVLIILAIACGVSVANIYYPQALSPLIARALHVPPASAALVTTAAQLGYAAGLFLLVPLGDRIAHRKLVASLTGLTGVLLLAASLCRSLPLLVALSALIGITTVTPQILIPMAAGLAVPERRGQTTGTMLSGLLAGILLARVYAGALGGWLGWRMPYLIAGALTLLLAVTLTFVVPATRPSSEQRYPALLAAAWQLLRTEPGLRRSCFYQATMFGGFSAAWTALALLVTGPAYHQGTGLVGLIALVGAASVFITPRAGRWIDGAGPERVNLLSTLGGLAAAAVLTGAVAHRAGGLLALFAGMLVLDIAVQCGQVANQARIFALRPDARSRLNTAYMTCAFLGGSAGSWLGVRAYTWLGWPAVCGLVALAAATALARHLLHRPAPVPVERAAAPGPAGCGVGADQR